MARALRWRDLTTGFVAAAALVAVAVSILAFGRAGSLRGRKFTVFVTTDGARGVIRGSDVWLDGQRVGLVANVDFRPPSVPPKERLVLTLRLFDEARARIRLDTHVRVRSGGTLLGDQVVALSGGTAAQRGVSDGDTIHAGPQVDLEGMTSDAALASREFPGILSNVKLLAAQLRTAQGTLAAFGLEHGSTQLAQLRRRTDRVLAQLNDTTGTIGLARRGASNENAAGGDASIRTRASHAMAQVDSIRTLLSSNAHSLGRFRRDSTLTVEIGRIRDELAETQRLASSPTGTIGRWRADSAVLRSVGRDRAAFDSLFIDMKKHPLRYIAF